MRAVVLQGEGAVGVEDVPDAALPGPDGAVVAVERTAICGSDLHLYHGVLGEARVQLGHEFIGTVTEVGPEVVTVAPGDRVLVSGIVACGRCGPCRRGDPVTCREGRTAAFGTSPDLPGGQSEAVGVPAVDAFSLKIPASIGVDDAVLLTDILPTGYLGAQRADITPGATVVVIGLGPVGIMALQCAQLFGPARVLALDVDPERRARAERLGAEVIDASEDGGVRAVLEATGGRGADAVIEAVGHQNTVLAAVHCAAPGGTVSIIGVNLDMALPFPMGLLFLKAQTVRATMASIPGTWGALVPLLESGRLRPEGIFTHRMGLSEAADAYRIFDRHEEGVLKVLLDPSS
jgi:threonine dehydrogenase-like Zn-dependent dehydrogenase